MPDLSLYASYKFFKANAGYIVGRSSEGALALAKAERAAQTAGAVIQWRDDADADWSFVETWSGNARRRWKLDSHYAEGCTLSVPCSCCGKLSQKASLWGIIDADNAYRRVIAAELALEAFGSDLTAS